ncbi:hypothetical protein GWK47_028093 [Chionoecetes opilio]|uniref:Uncharacterized protein n=1 Tax=Chionoecetes opilio TaxID=41210 RepID=A0A8J5D3P5_CHIOP|nr:hypothetical protein GWK47_028093 [Chionoecetes opilio]
MVEELTMDHFVDALQNRELQLYIKQAHPKDVREALAGALELEAFMRTSVGGVSTMGLPHPRVQCQACSGAQPAQEEATDLWTLESRRDPRPLLGMWPKGHWLYQCTRGRRSRSLERPAPNAFPPCRKSCGEYGHFSITCPWPKDVEQAGNEGPLAGGAASQPVSREPLAI